MQVTVIYDDRTYKSKVLTGEKDIDGLLEVFDLDNFKAVNSLRLPLEDGRLMFIGATVLRSAVFIVDL